MLRNPSRYSNRYKSWRGGLCSSTAGNILWPRPYIWTLYFTHPSKHLRQGPLIWSKPDSYLFWIILSWWHHCPGLTGYGPGVLGVFLSPEFCLLRQSLCITDWPGSQDLCLSLLSAEVIESATASGFSSRSLNPHLCVHWLINHVLLKSHWMCIWISPYHDPFFISGPLGHFHDGCQQVFLILLCFTFWHLIFNISFVLKIYPLINGLISVETWGPPTLVLSANTVIDFQGLFKKPILCY